jgi:3-oxoadipate enol-lactonase
VSTVVLCGSLGSVSRIWDAQAPVLAGREVVRIDHPGHGGAPLVEVGDVGDLAARVLDTIDGRFAFVGLSLGGCVGLRLALDAPERLDRLVVACTVSRFGEPAQWLERAETVRTEGLEGIVDAVLGRWFTPAFDGVPAYREMILSTAPEGYARCCEALARWDVGAELGRITTPTLVVAGAADPTAPPAEMEPLAAAIAGSRFAVIPEAAHMAPVERPAEFNRLLEEFL